MGLTRLTAVLCCAAAMVGTIVSARAQASAEAEVAFAYGVAAYNRGDHAEAVTQLERAVRADPDDGTARYWLGLARLKAGDAKGAVADLQASLASRRPPAIDRAQALTDLGAAQLEAGDAAAAEKTLREALALRDGDAGASYLHGLAVASLGRTDEGRQEAQAARERDATLPDVPPVVVAPATGGEVVPFERQPFWEIRVGADYGTDSNPSLLPDGTGEVIDPNTGQRLDGSDTSGSGDLRVEIHPFYDAAGWSLGLRLDAHQSAYGDLDVYDQGVVGGVVQLAWGRDPLGFVTGPMGYTRVPYGSARASYLLQIGSSYNYLDGDSFVRTHEAAGSVLIHEGATMATQLELDYRDMTYFTNDSFSFDSSLLSEKETTLRASQYFYGARRDRFVRVGALGGLNQADEDFFDARTLEGNAEASFPMGPRTAIHLSGAWRRDDFDELTQQGESHEEFTLTATGALVWSFVDHLYLTARLTWIDRTVEPETLEPLLEYDRTLASVGLTWYY